MLTRIVCILYFLCLPWSAFADSAGTPCASAVISEAIAQSAPEIDENTSEQSVKQWIYSVLSDKTVLTNVLKCPEIASLSPEDTITFSPIQFTFPNGREIVINYETQQKILTQRLTISEKRDLPSDDPNPRVGDKNDDSIWTNTDPAWYGIMVVESGALNQFVGPDKNNTISVKYINDNIDTLYPSGLNCTSRSALAEDNCAINRAVTNTVGIEGDTNDYYVAGDINLEWIGYAEIALDVVITVATFGTGTLALGAVKGAQSLRALNGMRNTLKTLRATDTVRDYIKYTGQANRLTAELKTIDRVTDATKYAEKTKELEKIQDTVKTLENADDVKKYRETSKTFSDLNSYRHTLKGAEFRKIPNRGNVAVRGVRATRAALKTLKAVTNGNKLIKRGAKLGRASKLSTRVRDYLFHSTLKTAGVLAKMQMATGAIYGALQTVGGLMYDFTETSTGEFTNDIDFKPLLLLSADDIQGQEDTINYGMWLMWYGDSQSPMDDDAAYLQAMDFAAKFHEDLLDIQEDSASPCDIDIFVVRPIIRNPDSQNPELYYLIMNDTPWTTHD